jgi:ketosteroid isomerase-like protein|tara:strand:- start:137 stop:286 length:150 start_codon:yes stop_codon:yes gene_type:complete
MSVIQKLLDAEENKDLDKFNKVMSEDFVWIKHSTGEQINFYIFFLIIFR